jgi:hypothetical protein
MDKHRPTRVAAEDVRGDARFKVIDTKTGDVVRNAFVLLPEVDSAARTALATYGEATRNVKVARYIRRMLHGIHNVRAERRE